MRLISEPDEESISGEFFVYVIRPRWEKFWDKTQEGVCDSDKSKLWRTLKKFWKLPDWDRSEASFETTNLLAFGTH